MSVREAARRHLRPGISVDQALILAAAELAREPLDPHDADDACIILRAEILLAANGVGEALTLARREFEDWKASRP